MKQPKNISLLLLFSATALIFLSAQSAQAINVINLTGFWQDENGSFIEIERNGPDAIAVMLSPQGRNNWMRGTMDLSGSDILLVKKRGTRTVGQVRGNFVNTFGGPRIRWDSGRTWRKSSQRDFNDSHHDDGDHDHARFGGIPATSSGLQGRWQTSDKTIIEINQKGPSLNVRVVSRQGSNQGRHPWTTGLGRITESQLSLDCYHGTTLAERVNGRFYPGSGNDARITWSNGQTWQRQSENFRVITDPVVAVCRLPVDVIGAAIPTRATSTWQYNDGGYFHRGGDGNWNEYSNEGKMRYQYRETQRTNISVTLFDDRRGISVHLQKDQCWMQPSSRADWKQISPGRWSQGPPNRSLQSGSRHSGNSHGQNGHSPTGYRPKSSQGSQPISGLGQLLQGLFRK